jgi:metal-responsive CopG/Arc/MetJ family transcriptional regulator
MATEHKPLLSNELLHQVEETARAQNREPAEIVSDAVRKYLDEQSWVRFVENNARRAKANGISEEDVDRLIDEVRRENAERGH